MDTPNLTCTIGKLFLIARALDDLLSEEHATLLHETGTKCRRILNTIATGVGELRHGLEALTSADLLYLATDGLQQSFPVDKTADSGYDKAE